MSLIEFIIDLMLADDDCVAKQSEYLQEIYAKSTNKRELDEAFVCLCGYSMKSLMEML